MYLIKAKEEEDEHCGADRKIDFKHGHDPGAVVQNLQPGRKTGLVSHLSLLPSGHCISDTIQRIEGIDNFIEMCKRLTRRTTQLKMEILAISQTDNVIIFDWIMTMMFKKYPNTPMYGATKLVLSEDGLIKEQRDYYDLWGDIFNNIPHFNKMYRRFLVKKFG